MSQGANSSELAQMEAPADTVNPEHGLPESFGEGLTGRVLFWIAVAFSTFQIITSFGIPLDQPFIASLNLTHLWAVAMAAWAAWLIGLAVRRRRILDGVLAWIAIAGAFGLVLWFGGSMPSQVVRTIHVGFLCLVAGAMIANHRSGSSSLRAVGWIVGVTSFLVGLYHWALYEELVIRAGELTTLDLVVGIAGLAILIYLIWRVMGPALPIVAGLFLSYCLFGHLLPAPLDHRGYSLEQVIEHMSFGTEGIYGTPTLVSATYIFLFILFGAFMEKAGVIDFFNDISMAVFGDKQGGPGKVCVASSALMGTVSGSGVANVVASGQFTIPLMKRFGFTSAFAGGVEATSSMGGQIMPPVMGAVAFIMAETIDVPYSKIVEAAIIPAVLYFAACYLAVHLEAGKRNLRGLPKSELPNAWTELRTKWFLIAPLGVLVYLLFTGYTPLFAGAVGLSLTVALILGTAIVAGFATPALRIAFWIGLALLSAYSLASTVTLVVLVVAGLCLWNAFSGRGRTTLQACVDALADGARQALPVGLACAVVGIVIGTMTLTGLGTIVGTWMISIGKENIFAALVLTMIFSLILGMGIPTIPNYIITSSLAAPILLQLDVPLIVSHMFVFYFGIMADLTPPVALAAFAAAPMAKESGLKIGIQAVRIALPGFVIPYMAVYDPTLMLQPVPGLEGAGYWLAVVYIVLKATLAMTLWGVASVGYFLKSVSWWERLWAAVAAAFLVAAIPLTDEVGFVLAGLFVGFHVWRSRQVATPAIG
ncbi:TRAP transporter permease [Microvirga terrae]|uniref:TRAP transporter permease n=1 Tax=Microvirga terrae TaxID=2740529 RepID=A0ABY5RQR1_9HYPH|nr:MULTISPECIES: TRAP transporter permease [Microvirga]MBQ0823969.1 TRAP transporter permease [Microvirga sp. HBU67558]UVF19127.1 TRAP transporter permease [Microvirga terrae]